jgi:hypothetical protein
MVDLKQQLYFTFCGKLQNKINQEPNRDYNILFKISSLVYVVKMATFSCQ